MLDSFYHMMLTVLKNHYFLRQNKKILSYTRQCHYVTLLNI